MAGSKVNFQVGLQFSADTKQAKAQLTDLSKSLENLVKNNMTNLPLTDKIREASQAASYLKASLDGAINANTGKLDISKFSESLKQGGYNVEQLKMHLESLGPEGIKAFQKVAVAVATAEAPAKRLSGLMTNLLRSFAQTAKYQFTASIYRGLIGGIQSAYHYAQDLNESLNNIRIVTGQSAEQMAKFAEQANKAAKQLSVTTTEYTNGALIYYQQGLSDEEVKARTDVTMKLANASGVSAETASEQLTAIWNNFAKGSENLEYFADVITALGASTASSTSEISEGLEKFAAIGESVGLSYEYAASALATVTATTRQSADVVGTAFKTLFARIQDLELGDTLEDGTTLGKYSQALAAVGVNIKESNGELKAMDQILNEMAGAWSTISKDQQVALAQTVAGTRQYTQLIALMENWGFMQQNLNTAYNSTGTLQEQANIYAESWEAAQKRVKAAWEDIYSSLINDDFFIDLLNFFEKFLSQIKVAINSLGGLQGVLFTISNLVMTFAGDSVAKGINNSIYNVRSALGLVKKDTEDFKTKITEMVGELSTSAYGERVGGFLKDFTALQSDLLAKYPQMTEEQKKQYDLILKSLDAAGDLLIKKEEELKTIRQINEEEAKKDQRTVNRIFNSTQSNGITLNSRKSNQSTNSDIADVESRIERGQKLNSNNDGTGSIPKLLRAFDNIKETLTKKEYELFQQLQQASQDIEKINNGDAAKIAKELIDEYRKVNNNLGPGNPYAILKGQITSNANGTHTSTQESAYATLNYFNENIVGKLGDAVPKELTTAFDKFKEDIEKAGTDTEKLQNAFKELQKVTSTTPLYNNESKKYYEELQQKVKETSEVIGKLNSAANFQKSIVKVEEKDLASLEIYKKELQGIITEMSGKGLNTKYLEEGLKNLNDELLKGPSNIENINKAFHDLQFTTYTEAEVLGMNNIEWAEFTTKLGLTQEQADALKEILLKLSEAVQREAQANADAARQHDLNADAIKRMAEQAKNLSAAQKDWGKGINSLGRAMSGIGQTLNTVKGLISQVKDGTLNLTTILTTVPSLIFGISSAIRGLGEAAAFLKIAAPELVLIITAIAGVALGIKGIINLVNADANAAKAAKEQVEGLAKAYQETKKAAEEFSNTTSNYNNATDGLKDLTKGTEEYKKQIEEANKAAEELIKKYGKELSGKWYFDTEGKIVINSEGLNSIKDTINTSTIESGRAFIEAQKNTNNLNLKAALTELVRSDSNSNNIGQREAINQLTENYFHNGRQLGLALADLSKEQRELIQHLDLESYLNKVYQYQQEDIQYNRKLALDFVNFNQEWKDAQDQFDNELSKELFLHLIEERQKETEKKTEDIDIQYDRSDDRNGLQTFYSQLKYGKISQQVGVFSPNEILSGIKADELIPQEVRDNLNVVGDELQLFGKTIAQGLDNKGEYSITLTNDFDGFADNIIQILKDEATANINNLEEVRKDTFTLYSQFKSIFTDEQALDFINSYKTGTIDFTKLTISKAKDFLNSDVLDPILSTYLNTDYFKDTEEARKKAQEAYNQYIQNFNSYYDHLRATSSPAAEIAASSDFAYKYDLETTKVITAELEKAFTYGGQQGMDQLAKTIKNTEDPLGILNVLNSTDWRTANFEELYSTLKGLGSEIDKNTFYNFANGLKEAADRTYILTSSLTDLFKEFKELKDITDKLSFGSVISDEDYQKYIKDKSEFDGKFVWTVDGWMFIGDKDEITITNDNIDKIRQKYTVAREDASKINSSDLELSNEALAKRYAYSTDEDGGFKFNQTALGLTNYNGQPLSEQALARAFEHPEIEESKKQIEVYGAALRQLKDTEKNYADNNVLTAHVQSQYKSVDELNKNWQALSKTWGDIDDSLATQLVKIAAINEATAKGIDKEELVDYANYLKTVNKQLANNEELTYQVAVANKIAQKAYKDTVSTYEADIETLKNDDPLSEAYRTSLERMRQNLADMLSISVDELSNIQADFFTNVDISKLYERIAQGDEEALQILTANAMIRAGQITEEEKQIYLEFLQYVANNPGTATIDAFVQLKGPGAEFLRGRAVAVDAAGIETDRNGNQATQGSIFDYNTYKPNLEKGKSSKKNLKSLDDEIDRYHYIRKLLADIERELERVDKAKERAYGSQHLKHIEQETDYLREQVGLQDRYISEIEGYLAKDRGLMAAYGAQFDEFGNISNYNQLFAANFNKYANADDSTNWENFKKALSTYEETLDLWFEQTEEKAEILRQILDKQLEGIQYKVNVKIELDDRELALLEYQLNRLDDAAYDTAEALVNIGSQFEVVEDKIKATTNGIVDTLKTIPGITQAQIDAYLAGDGEALAGLHIEQGQIDMLEDYSDQLLELSNTLKDLHDDALQKVSEAFDAWGEKIEDHTAKFQHLNALIENYQEIIGLLGRSNIGISNEFMREMRNQQITNLQGILNTRTQAKDVLAAQLADARKRATEATTQAEKEDWEQVADDIEQRLKEATESWQQAWIDALQANKEAFEETMQELVDSFNDYEDELKRYDTAQDRYLETYRQAYELSKLTRDIENSINDQDSIRAKKELQKLEDKITDIKESGRAISENELGLLQKEYELRLAEIALEDAQNAKSLVRLNRDNQGNWGYVYTADQDKIDEAQQNYEDKLYEYMRAADTMAEEASRTILTLNKEMAEALAALDANAVDYEAKVAEITQFYSDQIGYFAEQYGVSTDAMVNVARESAAKYKPDVVDIIDSDNSGLQTNFAETVLAIIGDFEDLEDAVNGPDGALPNIQRAYDETLSAFENYQEQNKITCERAGADVSQMRELMEAEFGKIKTQTKETDKATEEMANNMKSYLDQVLENFGDFATRYSNKIGVVSNANTDLAKSIIALENALQSIDASSLDTLKKAADKVDAIAQKVREVAADAEASGSGGGRGKGNNNFDYDTFDYDLEDETDNQALAKAADAYLKAKREQQKGTRTTMVGGGGGLVNNMSRYTFGSGGYTGEWGTDGRIAVLHEKELVLNKEDTANILDAVSLIRQMTLGTAQLSMGLGTIGAGLNNLNINPASMDQHVEIAASFPGVTDHYEIEEAFNNLVNKASQYAFRETRYQPRPDFI